MARRTKKGWALNAAALPFLLILGTADTGVASHNCHGGTQTVQRRRGDAACIAGTLSAGIQILTVRCNTRVISRNSDRCGGACFGAGQHGILCGVAANAPIENRE